jgi:cyclic pyranopterin phosphate synthase
MSERVIPLIDQRIASLAASLPAAPIAATGLLSDTLGRPLHDLRISVTDRCNFRCSYCMPKEVFDKDYPYLPHSSLLSFEEITRLAQQFVAHGVHKIRLTGGEPLLRKNLEVLVAQLAAGQAHARRPAAGPHAHHQRLAAAAQGPGPERRRPAARHGQPRRAGRQRLSQHERCGLPGG